jgi:hypothetical protein
MTSRSRPRFYQTSPAMLAFLVSLSLAAALS